MNKAVTAAVATIDARHAMTHPATEIVKVLVDANKN